MSTNIATEVRRISDARTRLKSIIDAQALANAQAISPDNLKYQTNATLAQSDEGVSDNYQIDNNGGSIAAASLQMPLAPIEPDMSTLMVWMPLSNLGTQSDLALMGHTGRPRGTLSLVAGPSGCANNLIPGAGSVRAIRFDGYTTFLDVPDHADIRLGSGYSVALRIKPSAFTKQIDNTTYERTIAAKSDDASNGWRLLFDTAGILYLQVKKGGVEYKAKSATAFALNTWYDIGFTFTGAACYLFWSDTQRGIASTAVYPYPAATDNDLHIGHFDNYLTAGNEFGVGAAFDPMSFDPPSFDTTDYLSGGPETSLSFDPTYQERVSVPYNPLFDNFKALTISAWINQPVTQSTYPLIVHKGYPSTGHFYVQVAPSNVMRFMSPGSALLTGTIVLTTGIWHHVVATWSGTQEKLYIDGVQDGSPVTATAVPVSLNAPLEFAGAASLPTQTLNATVGDVRIYNVELTATEIGRLYGGTAEVVRGLIAQFPFAEGTGTTTVDTRNGLVGTLTGTSGQLPTWITDPEFGQIPHSTINGGFAGSLSDFRIYNFALTGPQVTNLYANKFSISAMTLGQAAVAGYCLSHS